MTELTPDTTAADAALGVRMRPDLRARPARYAGHQYWTVKDPVGLRFFQLRDEEYFLLQQLDGHRSVAEIRAAFEQRFAPLQLGDDQLKAFVSRLYRSGLVVADLPGQGERLYARNQHKIRQRRFGSLIGILAIRFRGIDPEQFLRWIYPRCRWLFSGWFLFAALAMMLSAAALAVVQMDALIARLPSFQAFFTLENVVWMAGTLAIAKILHELGHALTCKHFGGECHELGVMLLVFTPCLYCNVSDAWMLPNKWHRIAISGAGIFVELALAAGCTLVWWFSEPGLLNSLCLNMMFVCSVNTVLFNGNPLLRYDGYYVLSDLVEVPNLRQTAMLLVQTRLARILFGIRSANERMLPERGRTWLSCYAVLALLYRIFVVIAILWFLHSVLQPQGLQVAAQLIGTIVIAGMLIHPLWRFKTFMIQTLKEHPWRPVRAFLSVAGLAAALVLVCLIPLPCRVTVPAWIEPHNATRVYIETTGTLVESASIGDVVSRGDSLAQLQDAGVQQKIARLEGQVAVLNSRLNYLKRQAVTSRSAGSRIPAAEEALRHVQQQLDQQLEQRARLHVTAPGAGVVLPAAEMVNRPAAGELETWTGTPLDQANRGCVLESGTTLCLLGDPDRLDAVVVIEQDDIEFVKPGQPVTVWLRQSPAALLQGTVSKISETRLDMVPPELMPYGQLPVTLDEAGESQPAAPCYQARIELRSAETPLLLRTTGKAKIQVAPRSLAQRLARYLASTFTLQL